MVGRTGDASPVSPAVATPLSLNAEVQKNGKNRCQTFHQVDTKTILLLPVYDASEDFYFALYKCAITVITFEHINMIMIMMMTITMTVTRRTGMSEIFTPLAVAPLLYAVSGSAKPLTALRRRSFANGSIHRQGALALSKGRLRGQIGT